MATDYNSLIYSRATATPYTDMYNAYKKNAEAQRTAEIARQNTLRDQDLAASNTQYDNSARQNYINYMQGRKNIAGDLNAQNIRGGASESSLIRLGTNYNSNVASNEAARNTALDSIRNQYAQALYDYEKAWKDDLNAKQAAYAEKQSEWERNQIAKNLEYFSSAIKGQYNSKQGYLDLIAQLQKSNDPNKVAKIMLTRQAMNEWLKENEESSSSGGGGGGGGGGYSRSYGSSGGGGGGGSSSGNYGKTSSNVSRTNYTKANLSKIQSYKPKRTTTGGSGSRRKVSSSYYTGSWRRY